MSRIVSLGAGLQDIYLIDRDDLAPTEIGGEAIFGKVLVGGKVDIDRLCYEVGGGGVNSAITFARYGHEAILLANVGRDSAGEAILRTLDREGVDSSYVNIAERRTTGTSVILLDAKRGERTILTYRGASERYDNFAVSDLDLIQPDWLYATTLRGDLETLNRFFKKAHALGAKVMFNPGVRELEAEKDLVKLLSQVDVLLVNKSEAARIVPGVLLEELLYHLNGYVETVIITDGAMGGIAGNRAEAYRFGIYEDRPVKDATGAGDAFGSGFLASLAAGRSFRQALTYASANSTAVVSCVGANRGILTRAEKLHLMPMQKI